MGKHAHARPFHPSVDWNTERPGRHYRLVTVQCPICEEHREVGANQAAFAIARKEFTGKCRRDKKIGTTIREPYPNVEGVDYGRWRDGTTKGGRRIREVVVTCPLCKTERWKQPSAIRVQSRLGLFTARCGRCTARYNGGGVFGLPPEHRPQPPNRKSGPSRYRRNIDGYMIASRRGLSLEMQAAFDIAAKGRRRILEHHMVMASILGRALHPDEVVHHRNGDRADNRPGNLRLYRRGNHHPGYGDFYQEWQEALAEVAQLKAQFTHGPASP